MLVRTVMPRVRMALLAVLTLALVATGWAHRVPEVPDEALAFMAATGATVADFCGEGGGAKHADPLCQACQIAGGAALPSPAEVMLALDLQVGETGFQPRDRASVARILDHSHAPQGPPVV